MPPCGPGLATRESSLLNGSDFLAANGQLMQRPANLTPGPREPMSPSSTTEWAAGGFWWHPRLQCSVANAHKKPNALVQ